LKTNKDTFYDSRKFKSFPNQNPCKGNTDNTFKELIIMTTQS